VHAGQDIAVVVGAELERCDLVEFFAANDLDDVSINLNLLFGFLAA